MGWAITACRTIGPSFHLCNPRNRRFPGYLHHSVSRAVFHGPPLLQHRLRHLHDQLPTEFLAIRRGGSAPQLFAGPDALLH
jgi:hypothetical protein